MALTESTMLALGTTAPDFQLQDVVSGQEYSLDKIHAEHGYLMMFICCHCPYVKHMEDELAKLGNEYQQKGVGVIAISSNDAENYPEDSPENLKAMAQRLDFQFPYLYDESQGVAKSYTAACTPDFFVFNKNKALVYRGQLDDSRPGNNIAVSGKDLRAALDLLVTGQAIPTDQKPSIGCNIKWR